MSDAEQKPGTHTRSLAYRRQLRVYETGFVEAPIVEVASQGGVGDGEKRMDDGNGEGQRQRRQREYAVGFNEMDRREDQRAGGGYQSDVAPAGTTEGATTGEVNVKAKRRANRVYMEGYSGELANDSRPEYLYAPGFTGAEGVGPDVPTEKEQIRTLRSIEESPDTEPPPPLHEVIDQIITDMQPRDRKNYIYAPPPEARNLMVRNISQRHNKAEHPLEGYLKRDKSNADQSTELHLDSMTYPQDFLPPLECSYTEQQLREVHWKIKNANYNTSSYQDKLHFAKGARLTQLEWELNNINMLSEVSKELVELENELIAWQC